MPTKRRKSTSSSSVSMGASRGGRGGSVVRSSASKPTGSSLSGIRKSLTGKATAKGTRRATVTRSAGGRATVSNYGQTKRNTTSGRRRRSSR